MEDVWNLGWLERANNRPEPNRDVLTLQGTSSSSSSIDARL